MRTLQDARDEAAAAHELARQKMAARITRGFKPFTRGQKVWLEATNLRIPGSNKKMSPKREGPFEVAEVLGPLTYRLKLPSQWKIHPVFHASLLTPYHTTEVHGPNFINPPPDEVDGEEEYEVEAIVGHKFVRRRMLYLVKWSGYATSENSWQTEKDLLNSTDILTAYKQAHRIR